MKVKTALLFHRNVSATGTTVYVKDGIVTLQGKPAAWRKRTLPPNTPGTLTMSKRSRTT